MATRTPAPARTVVAELACTNHQAVLCGSELSKEHVNFFGETEFKNKAQ